MVMNNESQHFKMRNQREKNEVWGYSYNPRHATIIPVYIFLTSRSLKSIFCYLEDAIKPNDQDIATANRRDKWKPVIAVSGECVCFSLRAKRFYSNLLYKRDLQRPDAICHFPRALVGNQAALMQDGESNPTSRGLTFPALHKIRDRKWRIVWRFRIYCPFILNGLVVITGTKKPLPIHSYYGQFQQDICNIIACRSAHARRRGRA